MIFDGQHYVPVLKVKRGEKRALGLISQQVQARTTPLLEIVERKAENTPTVAGHLNTAFQSLAESVQGYSRIFLDLREIASDGPVAAAQAFDQATNLGIVYTPVTGVSRTVDIAAALEHRTHGLALRLTRSEFEAGGLALSLRGFMSRHGLAPEQVDLIVDLGAVDDLVAEGIGALTNAFLAEVPDHRRWQTITLSACAFPSSMGGVERRSNALAERLEWLAWRDGLFAWRDHLQRLPTFSDCAVQHPIGVEGFDPRMMQVSAAVRYTLSTAWLLIKGQSTRTTPPSVQFPQLATQLVYGHLRSNFAGASHCSGCASMKAAADGGRGLGSAEAWRRLATIHHITVAAQGLSSLPLP